MMDKDTLIFSTTASVLTFLFGNFDVPLQVLIVFVITDFLTGLVKAWFNNNLSSQQGYKGLMKKCGIMVVIMVAVMLDLLTGTVLFRIPVCWFFIAIEGISVLENLGNIGVPIPKFLLDKLIQIKNVNNMGDKEEIEEAQE
ncbi:holin family protein [uncultured Clostridium sp.]|uniref:phage holin family protein n=1 Tax=uncultured Clostridium sp. TaxID=59620 RepID=UPI0025E463A1|nr:phage holin family protein [uncultured Clostridium sp.]